MKNTVISPAIAMLFSSIALTSCSADATNDVSSVIEPGAKLELLAREFRFTEGPTSDKDGNVFFTDQPNNRIMKWSVDGKLSTFLQPSGRANGMFFDKAGNLIACADEKNELWSLDMSGTHTVLTNAFEGNPLNGPNDVWIHPSGAIYFTDPLYQRPWWENKGPRQSTQQVYRLTPDLKMLTRATDDLIQPNGITGTPDGKRLYVADLGAKKTYVYEIAENGSLTNRKLHCEMGSDGMTLDTQENLYLTGKGVFVFNKAGAQIEHIEVPERWAANVSFGGKDHRTLFITASEGLYSIRMKFPGANAAK